MRKQAMLSVSAAMYPQEHTLGAPGSMTAMLLTLPLWFLKGSTTFFVKFTRRTCRASQPPVDTADAADPAQRRGVHCRQEMSPQGVGWMRMHTVLDCIA